MSTRVCVFPYICFLCITERCMMLSTGLNEISLSLLTIAKSPNPIWVYYTIFTSLSLLYNGKVSEIIYKNLQNYMYIFFPMDVRSE